jgi:hypothetical protein
VVTNGEKKHRSTSPQLSQLARHQATDQIVVPRVGVGTAEAADGQQPVFVTTGEHGLKPWKIMTANPAIDGH